MRKKIFLTISVLLLVIVLSASLMGCTTYKYYTDINGTKVALDSEVFNYGFGTNNNGYAKNDEEVQRLIGVKPSEKQLAYAELEYYNFIHYGMNTYTDVEWGDGKTDPSVFNPTNLDTDQWCEALKASGSKGIILTAKHHDGFCLWPSKYTDYTIANSPYKNGQGDIVKELSESCKKYGLKFGVYLSPWDMHEKTYGKNSYNDFFVNQLTELMTNYGEIFAVWFDGARGEDAVIDKDFEYDFKRYYDTIKQYQPMAVTAVQGEDVRWVGNEAGVARESEWNVVSKGNEAMPGFQTDAATGEELKGVKFDDRDTGSRDLLKKYKDLVWFPAEVDVSIRQGWFYHSNQKPKDLQHLLSIYYKSVGANSSLLLNVPPNKAGRIDSKDVKRLKEFGDAIAKTTQNKLAYESVKVGNGTSMSANARLNDLATDTLDSTFEFGSEDYILDFKFAQSTLVKRIDIREDLRHSQRVEKYDIWAKVKDKWVLVSMNTNIGNRRTVILEKGIETDTIRIVITQSRSNPILRSVQIYG